MKYVNFIFQVHQPFRLKEFHFFDIGSHKSYYDEDRNKAIFREIAERSYLPTNRLLIELIETYGERIKISLAISGTALDQMELYAPEVLESFQQLAANGNIEFLGQTYSASLASLINETVFYDEVSRHRDRIIALFGQTPTSFFNTELIYSDDIGAVVYDMGFKATVIEGLPAILKNRNAYAIYNSAASPSLKLLLRNQSLSDDIALRFSQRYWSEWPLTADKYLNWLKALKPNEKVVNLVMDYATIGEHYKEDTGIFDFFKYLFLFLATEKHIKLSTPNEVITYKTPSKLMVKYPVSWAGKQRSISVWEGNQMQQEAFETLYACKNNIGKSKDKLLLRDWTYLQSADHFYYMDETSEFGNNAISPYNSNYEAFVNYMNVLSDFVIRIETIDNENLIKNPIKYAE